MATSKVPGAMQCGQCRKLRLTQEGSDRCPVCGEKMFSVHRAKGGTKQGLTRVEKAKRMSSSAPINYKKRSS